MTGKRPRRRTSLVYTPLSMGFFLILAAA